jgi:hypothetical protein
MDGVELICYNISQDTAGEHEQAVSIRRTTASTCKFRFFLLEGKHTVPLLVSRRSLDCTAFHNAGFDVAYFSVTLGAIQVVLTAAGDVETSF